MALTTLSRLLPLLSLAALLPTSCPCTDAQPHTLLPERLHLSPPALCKRHAELVRLSALSLASQPYASSLQVALDLLRPAYPHLRREV